ncbi:MAG: type II toxin-antitoxin system Phd/YefM family antitoxin [Chthoniobacterales bacterium]
MSTASYSYTQAREQLATVWDETIATREPVTISRRGYESVVMLPLDEWRGILETAHLLRSPANARRLLDTLHRIDQGDEGEVMTIDELKKRVNLV